MKKVVVLTGPTATGKTAYSIRIAQAIGGEVVNVDSLLFYRELNIGSAKPTLAERAGIPHHMVDIRSIRDPMNASDYALEVTPVIHEIHGRGKPVVLVGGSGFYVQALLKGMYHSPTTPPELHERSDVLYEAEGIAPFRDILKVHDPINFERYHENDHYRIRRAVEHFWANGSAFSAERDAFNPHAPNWQLLNVHLDFDKVEHLPYIVKRTRDMIEAGLVEEVLALLADGYSGEEKPLQSIGYKETLDWIKGKYGDDFRAYEDRIVINTRQLAKTQRNWFRKGEKTVYDPRTEGEALLSAVRKFNDQG